MILAALVWSLLSYMIVVRTGSVIVDGFQSIGSAAAASGPGQLRWPFMGSFMGYNHCWGFHWFGWPWLRSLLLPLLPWSPGGDIALGCVLWATASLVTFKLVAAQGKKEGLFCGLLMLAAPSFLVAAQSYRPEIPAALALVGAFALWSRTSRASSLFRALLLLLLPTLHPLGLVVPATWCLLGFVAQWRLSGFASALRSCGWHVLPLAGGVALFAFWFALQPDAWAQFELNVRSQRLLTEGMGTGIGTFFRWGFGSLGSAPLALLLLVACGQATTVVLGTLRGPAREISLEACAAFGLLTAIAFNIATRNPNVLHLLMVMPLAAILFKNALWRIFAHDGTPWRVVVMTGSLVGFSSLAIKQGVGLIRHQGVGYRDELASALRQLPDSRQVLIPVAFWEAALKRGKDARTSYRLSTFPNILPRAERAAYENSLATELQSGDLIVWDSLQEEGGVFNFVGETALRHQVIRPPDQEALWERLPDLVIPVAYSKGQSTAFRIYRRR